MNIKHFMTAAAAIITLTTAFEASAAWTRCLEDQLNYSQATGRNDWSLAYGYIDQGTYAFLQSQAMYVVYDKGSYMYGVDGDPNNPKVWVSDGSPNILYTNMLLEGFCKAGCYTPQQKIMTERGLVAVKDAHDSGIQTVMAATTNSSLGNMQFAPQVIQDFIVGDTDEAIYVLRGDGGQELQVTSEHPMVLENGKIVHVGSLEVGDVLLGEHGQPVVIDGIDTFQSQGEVWNLQPVSEVKQENILVAEGFLTGSLRFQNEWSEDATKLLRRDTIRTAKGS